MRLLEAGPSWQSVCWLACGLPAAGDSRRGCLLTLLERTHLTNVPRAPSFWACWEGACALSSLIHGRGAQLCLGFREKPLLRSGSRGHMLRHAMHTFVAIPGKALCASAIMLCLCYAWAYLQPSDMLLILIDQEHSRVPACPCMLRAVSWVLTVLLRYSFYTNVESVRMLPVTQNNLYRRNGKALEMGDGKLLLLFAGSALGSKAFAVDMETADIYVRHAVAGHALLKGVLHACLACCSVCGVTETQGIARGCRHC